MNLPGPVMSLSPVTMELTWEKLPDKACGWQAFLAPNCLPVSWPMSGTPITPSQLYNRKQIWSLSVFELKMDLILNYTYNLMT